MFAVNKISRTVPRVCQRTNASILSGIRAMPSQPLIHRSYNTGKKSSGGDVAVQKGPSGSNLERRRVDPIFRDPFFEDDDFWNFRLPGVTEGNWFFSPITSSKTPRGVLRRHSNVSSPVTLLTEVKDTPKEYVLTFDCPGVKKEEIKVSIQEGILTVSGERKKEEEQKGEKYHVYEKSYGRFERKMEIPDNADTKGIKADYNEGVLKIVLPKLPETTAPTIEVKVQ